MEQILLRNLLHNLLNYTLFIVSCVLFMFLRGFAFCMFVYIVDLKLWLLFFAVYLPR